MGAGETACGEVRLSVFHEIWTYVGRLVKRRGMVTFVCVESISIYYHASKENDIWNNVMTLCDHFLFYRVCSSVK